MKTVKDKIRAVKRNLRKPIRYGRKKTVELITGKVKMKTAMTVIVEEDKGG